MCENSDLNITFFSENDKIDDIVRIHMESFPNFFLTFLGSGFLKTLYLEYKRDENSGIIVAKKNNKIEGFLAYSYDYSGFYKRLIKKKLFTFAFYAFGAFIRKPKIFFRLLGAFSKSKEVVHKDNYVEVASIAVSIDSESSGIGTKMLDFLKRQIDFKKYEYINLETDAFNNEKANNFYKKNGFILSRSYFTKEGRKMNEYRYKQ